MKYLLEVMLAINVFFALFPAWRLSPLWNWYDVDTYFTGWMGTLMLLNLAISIIILCFDHNFKNKIIFYSILFLELTFAISIGANNFQNGLIAIIGIPVMYFVLFITIEKYQCSNFLSKVILFIFILWSVVPVILLLIGPNEYKVMMFMSVKETISTFGGFALHRNFYGFYAGLTILLLIFSKINKYIKFVLIIICLVGIFLSASRSSLLCIGVSSLLLVYLKNKKLFFTLLPFCIGLIAFGIFLYSYIGLRDKGLEDNDDRFELLKGFWSIILKNPLTGVGQTALYFSSSYPEGSPAHNFIAQIWADYGLINLITFTALFFNIFRYANNVNKVFVCYLILFGVSQPYFYLSVPQAFMVITILLSGFVVPSFTKKNNDQRYLNIKP